LADSQNLKAALLGIWETLIRSPLEVLSPRSEEKTDSVKMHLFSIKICPYVCEERMTFHFNNGVAVHIFLLTRIGNQKKSMQITHRDQRKKKMQTTHRDQRKKNMQITHRD